MVKVKTHPLIEVIAKKLLGIESVPLAEQQKMVSQACKAAVEWHDKETSHHMPVSLTAENGAKALLSGEFYEHFEMQCPQCGGAGSIEDEFEFGDEEISCDHCDGYGEYTVRVPVSWTTIKEIYKKIVEHYSNESNNHNR